MFQILLTLGKGHSSTTVVVPHNYNHHRLVGQNGDWISPSLAGQGRGVVRLIRYIYRASREMSQRRHQTDAPKLPIKKQRDMVIERVFLVIFVLVLCYLDIQKAAVYVFIPWIGSMLALVGINLLQHEGCDPNSNINHSRNFTSLLANWLYFNNGYHTIHHIRPALHWSLLPEAHRKMVVPSIDSNLIENSMLKFALKNYTIWSNKPNVPPHLENKLSPFRRSA